MLTGILQLAFNAADMIIVGQAEGADPVGQVGATGALINLIVGLFTGFSVGVSVCVSREYGAKNYENVSKYVHTSIATAIVGGVVCSLVGLIGARYFLTLMSTPATHIDGASLYMRIYFLSMPASMVYNFGAAILRSLGNSKTPLLILSTSGVINVLFNLMFVNLFGLAVEGVAIATVISQYVALVWMLIYLSRVDGPHRLVFKKIAFIPKCLKSIVTIGLPAGISGSLFSLSNVVVQSSINSFGGVVVNGNTAASNIEGFIYTASNSFHQTAITFVGQNRGAGKFDRILKSLWICLMYSFIFEVSLALISVSFREALLGIYIKDSEKAIAVGVMRLMLIGIPHFLCGAMDVMNGVLRGMGYSLSPTLISLTCACFFRVVWISTVFKAIPRLETVYVIYPISWALCIICLSVLFIFAYRSSKKKALLEIQS
ncbi:MAG: MATE family efflux transporter [Clostridia bacterium]|nr:MATE family efflux transporter [Clostridia bacterium]MBQ9749061.1 MATE family efflux transporter [Clostridia bacterium]